MLFTIATQNLGGFGGGAYNYGTLLIENCTFNGNTADKNSSSILNNQNVELRNTILQKGGSFKHLVSFSGNVVSKGYNLSDDDGSGFLNQTGDLTNTNAQLGPLQDNGGPTPTHAIERTSPAYNAGDPNFAPPPATDQRSVGFARVVEGRLDIGAFERQAPQLSINDITVEEGNRGTPNAVFTVTLSEPSPNEVRVRYVTQGRLLRGTDDYVHVDDILVIPAGNTSATISVPIINDDIDEDDEIFNVILYLPQQATIADNVGACTIVDDDRAPSFSINNLTVSEGGEAKFTITLSAPSQRIVTVAAVTSNGTAKAPSDYIAIGRRLYFPPGTTTQTLDVSVRPDQRYEPDEVFYMILSQPVNASIGRGRGICTILDDDDAPTVSVEDCSIIEGSNGLRALKFRLKLSEASGYGVKVTCATSPSNASNAATPNVDYQTLAPTQSRFLGGC